MALFKYGCKGSCNLTLSEDEYNSGNHVCKTDGCSHLGQPFVKKNICNNCGADYFENETHKCNY